MVRFILFIYSQEFNNNLTTNDKSYSWDRHVTCHDGGVHGELVQTESERRGPYCLRYRRRKDPAQRRRTGRPVDHHHVAARTSRSHVHDARHINNAPYRGVPARRSCPDLARTGSAALYARELITTRTYSRQVLTCDVMTTGPQRRWDILVLSSDHSTEQLSETYRCWLGNGYSHRKIDQNKVKPVCFISLFHTDTIVGGLA